MRAVEEVAGVIPGERPSRAVGAAQPRRQADDEEACVMRAEGAHRGVVPGRLGLPPFLAEGGEPGTERTVATGLRRCRGRLVDGNRHRRQNASSSSNSSWKVVVCTRSAWRCARSAGSRPTFACMLTRSMK